MKTKPVIQVENLTKIYKLYQKPSDRLKEALGLSRHPLGKDHYALREISFSISEGECVGIIGTNGSGKSTLLKIITGVLGPTRGHVEVDGRISALLELGAGFNTEYTGLENIYLNGTMLGFSREEIDAKKDEILAFADIGEYINQPVKTYSSGMFVRLAFALAINIDPEILVVDEALSVGDVFFQAKCFHKFEEFKKAGRTILFVSHDLSSVAKYCDRVILLNKGDKLDEGSPKKIIDEYKQLLVGQMPAGATAEQESRNAEAKPAAEEDSFRINPDPLEYGNKEAQITRFSVYDERGRRTNIIEKGTTFSIEMEVTFHQDLDEPILAYTFKNVQGTEITGTNTLFEGAAKIEGRAGTTCKAVFTQRMDMQGGEYLLSFGCTGYRDGDFTVFHRLYDACPVTVLAKKNTVGFYDMNSRVMITQ